LHSALENYHNALYRSTGTGIEARMCWHRSGASAGKVLGQCAGLDWPGDINASLARFSCAGVFAAFLAILHTGHKYQSVLGTALIATTLIVVVTGLIGRYYFPQTSAELREQESQLAALRLTYNRISIVLPERRTLEPAVAGEVNAPCVAGYRAACRGDCRPRICNWVARCAKAGLRAMDRCACRRSDPDVPVVGAAYCGRGLLWAAVVAVMGL
jgi:hypothetical protein